jgi:23S rRNA (cytidine1920-2'-O)/16S rRNA (cytidine1409-2'-O)-methyltransferase
MVRRGLARSRAHASELIEAGAVRVGGIAEPKPATLVEGGEPIEVSTEAPRYVSRGGVKLAGAMDSFGLDVTGRRALDAGASTGGFTDWLLAHGAAEVVAVDVGYGQLDHRLASDPRVTVLDRTNLRRLVPEDAGGRFGLVVGDLSFISLCTVAPALAALAAPGADLVLLVKPQFEVGKGQVGKGGVVTEPALQEEAVQKVEACLVKQGLTVCRVVESPIRGAKGNREFFVWARAGGEVGS